MAYESLGPWDRLMDNSQGQRYRLWKYRDGATGEMVVEKFPFHWEDYFSRPSIYPQTPLGNLFYDVRLIFTIFLDKWYNMGYLRSRGAVRLAVIVRECPFIVIKLSKFNSSVTYCPICPINWLYCSKTDAQRLDIIFDSN